MSNEKDDKHTDALKNYFESIYNHDNPQMPDPETVCGPGSKAACTIEWLNFLQFIINKYKISSLLDIGCGDLNYIHPFLYKNEQLSYHGYDISSPLISTNRIKHPTISCSQLNICSNVPKHGGELCILKEIFIHLSPSNVFKALANIKKNKTIKYILVSGHTDDFSIIETNESGGGQFAYKFQGFKKNPLEIFNDPPLSAFSGIEHRLTHLYSYNSI